MTFVEVLRTLIRRWYVMAGTLVCIALAILLVSRVDGVYSTRVNLVFLPPTIVTSDANTLRWSSESLIDFAAVVERAYNGNTPQPRFAATDTPIYGNGETSGVKVFLPNSGGQWSSDFRDATLVVEVVDPSRERVVQRLDEVVRDLQALALARQVGAGSDAEHRISVLVSDETTAIQFVQGSTARAAGAIVLLGLGIGGVAAVLLEGALTRRSQRRGSGRWPYPRGAPQPETTHAR